MDILNFEEVRNIKINESAIISDILKNVKKGLLIDVGANVGNVSKMFAQRGWDVIAFEPDPDNMVLFKNNTASCENIKVFSDAISDTDGNEVTFYSSPESIGISSMLAFTDGHKPVCTVKTKTLAAFVAENNIKSIDFLKIDIEGYDLFALKGLDWDADVSIGVILCEFEDRKTKLLNYNSHDMAEYLMSKGYEVYVSEWYPLVRYGGNPSFHCLKKYPCDIDTESTGNFIAFKNGCEAQTVKAAFSKSVHSHTEKVRLIEMAKNGDIKAIGWGTGGAYQKSKPLGIKLSGLIDGKGANGELDGIAVCGPQILLEEDPENTVIIVFSMFYDEICKKISEYGEFKSVEFTYCK